MRRTRSFVLIIISDSLLRAGSAQAGMGVPIPNFPDYEELPQIRSLSPWFDARLQTLSFFLVALFVIAIVVRWMWNLLRRDWPKLPEMTYRGAFVTTGLWALLSIVVLTMISGARELMTPGAWKQHGWTYQLNDKTSTASLTHPDMELVIRMNKRYEGMKLFEAWVQKYAKEHGKYPDASEAGPYWEVPTYPGQHYLIRNDLTPDDWGDILAFEPFSEGPCYTVTIGGDIGMVEQSVVQELRANFPKPVTPMPKSLEGGPPPPVQKSPSL